MKKAMFVFIAVLIIISFYAAMGCKSGKNPASNEGPAATGTFTATQTITQTSTVTATATQTMTPNASSQTMGFESGVSGWSSSDSTVTGFAQNTSIYHSGAASLSMNVCMSASASMAQINYTCSPGTLYMLGKTLTFWLYVTPDMAANSTSLYFYFGYVTCSGSTISQGGVIPSSSGWHQYSFSIPGAATACVTKFNFELHNISPSTFYFCEPFIIDDISW